MHEINIAGYEQVINEPANEWLDDGKSIHSNTGFEQTDFLKAEAECIFN